MPPEQLPHPGALLGVERPVIAQDARYVRVGEIPEERIRDLDVIGAHAVARPACDEAIVGGDLGCTGFERSTGFLGA